MTKKKEENKSSSTTMQNHLKSNDENSSKNLDMKKLLEDAVAEHRDLLNESGLDDTCWSGYIDSSIIQLFHQVTVKLEKDLWECDYTNEPFMRKRGRKYLIRSVRMLKSLKLDGRDYFAFKNRELEFVGYTGNLGNLHVKFSDDEGNELILEGYWFIEDFFTMIQREIKK